MKGGGRSIIKRLEVEEGREGRCQFHQHFYVPIFCTNVVSADFSSYVSALAPKFCTENARVNVDEIESRCQFHQYFTRAFLYERLFSA